MNYMAIERTLVTWNSCPL